MTTTGRYMGENVARRWVADHDPLPMGALRDELVEQFGHGASSPYVSTFWLPILGPTATIAYQRLAGPLGVIEGGLEMPLGAFAAELGVGHRGGNYSPMVRTLARLVRFGAAEIVGARYLVRLCLAPLTSRQVASLPSHLQHRHAAAILPKGRAA